MIVRDQILNVERSCQFEETSFKIQTTAKAFKILSSGLYSDKIKSCIRELSCNAYDAQVVVNKQDKPFQVHLPNQFEPFFSIRDFGKSLTDEEIRTVYTTYFMSDKTDSNDLVGCMGLGSKSPFSYTDSFSIVAYLDGVKRSYTAFIDEYGMPCIANLAEDDTTEDNGLEVSFPVRYTDYYSFKEKAREVYRWFTVRPNIVGQEIDFSMVDSKPTYKLSNYELYKGGNGHRLVMGNVCYPVCLKDADCEHALFNNVSILINAPIGAAEMTASRESLEYTPLTKTTIKNATDEAVKMWTDLVEKDLQAQPTYWDACLFYKNNQLWLQGKPEWQKRPVGHSIKLSAKLEGKTCCKAYSYRKRGGLVYDAYAWDALRVDEKVIFVEDDLEKGTKARVMQYVRNSVEDIKVIIYDSANVKLIDELGLPAYKNIKASSLPKVKYNKNGQSRPKVVYLFSSQGSNSKTQCWHTVELTSVTEGVYVELDMWDVKTFGSGWRVASYLKALKNTGYNINIYGVRKAALKKVRSNPKWVTLEEKLRQVQKENAGDKDLILHYEEYQNYAGLKKLKNLLTGIDLSKLIDKIEYVEKNATRFANLSSIMSFGQADRPTTQAVELGEIEKKYPLLFFIMRNHGSETWPKDNLVNYIKLINKENINV